MGEIAAGALLYGLTLSLIPALIMGVSLALAPDMWVGDYPLDIREKYGAMSDRGRRYRPFMGVLFFGAVLLIVGLSSLRLHDVMPTAPRFTDYLSSNFIVLMVFNLFDLLIADWLVFVTIQPKAVILPGTVGMAGYKNYRFHFRGFLIGILSSAVAAALLAGIALGLGRILM